MTEKKLCRCGHPKHEAQCPAVDGCWCDTFTRGGVKEPRLEGRELVRLMQKYRVTIRGLADTMDVTQKRVRYVRAKGVTGRHYRTDWIQGVVDAAEGS